MCNECSLFAYFLCILNCRKCLSHRKVKIATMQLGESEVQRGLVICLQQFITVDMQLGMQVQGNIEKSELPFVP